MEPACASSREKVSQGSRVAVPSSMEAVRLPKCRQGFCEEIVEVFAIDVRKSQYIFIGECDQDSPIDDVEGILFHARPLYGR